MYRESRASHSWSNSVVVRSRAHSAGGTGGNLEGEAAVVPPYGEPQRLLGRRVGERLPRRVASDDGRLLDLEDHVAALEPGACGRAVPHHQADDGRARPARPPAAELGLRAVGLAQEEAVLGGHALAGDGA